MDKKRKKALFAMAFTLVIGMTAATLFPSMAEAKVKVKSVKVTAPYAKTAYVAKGKSVKIAPKVTVTPNKSANKKVTYKSKNKKVATISSSGVIKAKKVGKTKVVVTSKKNKKKKATITVRVMKKAVTKVTLNKKTASVVAGKTLTLKKTIKPTSNVSKIVKWTTSNKKIATVTSKGVVKGIKAGKATIKATATDGSKKSASCVVTVKNAGEVSIKSIEVMDDCNILVTLSSAKALTVADFNVQTKATASGKYVRTNVVKGATTLDSVVYNVRCEDKFYNDNYLKVTVNALTGIKTKEILIKKHLNKAGLTEQIISGMVGKNISKIHIGFDDYITGEATYSVTGLPTGFYTKISEGNLYICGKSATVVDNAIATATATDETGKTVTRNIRILVGSDTQMVAYVKPITILSNQLYFGVTNDVTVAGGNGNYSVTATPDAALTSYENVVSLSSYEDVYRFYVDAKYNETTKKFEQPSFPAGKYTYAYKITDSNNVSITKNLDITTVDGTTLSGYLRDATGEGIANAMVTAYCTTSNEIQMASAQNVTDATGRYSMRIIGGQSYDVSGVCTTKYEVEVPTTGAMVDIRSPYYKVNINMAVAGATRVEYGQDYFDSLNDDESSKYSYAVFNNATDYSQISDIYVTNGVYYFLPGTYSYTTKATFGDNSTHPLVAYDAAGKRIGDYYDASFTVTVTDKNQTVNATVTAKPITTLTADTPINVTIGAYETEYFTFTATEDDTIDYTLLSDTLTGEVYVRPNYKYYDKGSSISESYSMGKGDTKTIRVQNRTGDTMTITNLRMVVPQG